MNMLKSFVMPIAVTFGIGTVFFTMQVATQQIMRHDANDPQISLVRDMVDAQADGKTIEQLKPRFAEQIEISKSLSPYVVIYDDKGVPLLSSGLIHGGLPMLPGGIFDYVAHNGETRITWQPEPNVRHAIIVLKSSKGFVMSGRSLVEVEKREREIRSMIGIGGAVTMVIAWAALFLLRTKKRQV